ncbi:MAG: WG repeat-containing protein, partial [Clostridium sp.]|nr:WG repeat-containing protein [Clostridium sp.]
DGTLVRKVSVTGSVDAISSRTVLHTEQGKGITLIHLESGETLTEFEKPYTDAVPLWPLEGGVQFSTGLFYAIYTDETGRQRVDLLRENGAVMREDLIGYYDSEIARQGAGPYEGGGAFRVEGGYRHLDGTWLYREPSPQPETLPADSVCVLELSGGDCVAVDQTGAELLRVDGDGLYPLTDKATGEILAICRTVHPEDPENDKCTTTIYDLSGNLLRDLEAWGIQVFVDVVIVQWDSAEYALYSRSAERALQSDLEKADVLGSTVMACPRGETYNTAFWSKGGGLIANVGSKEQEIRFFAEVWNGTAYYEIYNVYLREDGTRTTGNHGVIDDHGNWIVEPQYQNLELLANGYAACFDGAFQNVVDLDTGKVVAQLPAEAGPVKGAYENLLLVSLNENPRTVQQALRWDGTPVTDAADQIIVIDDEGDGIAELLQFYRGNNTVWLLPDGTLLREAVCQGSAVTSQTALLLGEKLRLLDLRTGEELPLPDRGYNDAMALWPGKGDADYASGLFFASYTDENGQTRTDILREDGTLLLENYACERSKWGWDYERGGAFRVEGGYRHLDGTWLYRE